MDRAISEIGSGNEGKEQLYRSITETIYLSWNHPDEEGKSPADNSEELKDKLRQLHERTTPVVALDGLSASTLNPEYGPGLEKVNNLPGLGDVLDIFPDGTIVVGGDPAILNWITTELVADYFKYDVPHRAIRDTRLNGIVRDMPLMVALGAAGVLLDREDGERKLSRRNFLKYGGVAGAGIGVRHLLGKFIDRLDIVAQRGITTNMNENQSAYDTELKVPWGINERTISSMNKMHHCLQAMEKAGLSFDKPVQPVALFGSLHFMSDEFLSFGEQASQDGYSSRIKQELSSGKIGEIWTKILSGRDDRDRILQKLEYDLTHGVILQKVTNPDTMKSEFREFSIPWIGSVLHPFNLDLS